MLVTGWEPYRLAIELTTVVDAAAASLWLDGISEPRAMLERGFARVFGRAAGRQRRTSKAKPKTAQRSEDPPAVSTYAQTYSPRERDGARSAAEIALACDRYPFSGYPRWEINSRWDVISRREPLTAYRREERFFARLLATCRNTRNRPEALLASVALRWYFAARDVWVREAQRRYPVDSREEPRKLTSAWRVGLAAARSMWRRTRDARVAGPNELILLADAERLAALRRGEPVFGGAWQLCYAVENDTPAVQLVGIEQRRDDGAWELKQACHTIEFVAAAAKPTGGFVRDHAAPVAWNGDMNHLPQLRVVVRGVGRVRISAVVLTDGQTAMRVGFHSRTLGQPAPTRGFPVFREAFLPLRFETT
jgi:hypothetical protein